MKYATLTNSQLLIMTLLTGLIAGAISIGVSMYREYSLLPAVYRAASAECIKVVNFENGHAYGCPDVDVLLRRYRTISE